MAATFPTYGQMSLGEYSESGDPGLLRTPMESGPPKQALVAARSMLQREISLVYTASEFQSFRTWWRDTIARGTDWFSWDDPVDGATKLVRIPGGRYRARPFAPSPGEALSWEVALVLEGWDI